MVNEQDSDQQHQQQQNRKKSSVKKFFSKLGGGSSNNDSSNSPQTPSPSSSQESLTGSSHHQGLGNFVKEAMPHDEDEIDRRFMEAVEQIGIQNEAKQMFISKHKTKEMKWDFVQSLRKNQDTFSSDERNKVDYYIHCLQKSSSVVGPSMERINSDKSIEEMIKLVQKLTVQLRSQPITWLEEFIRQGGLYQLTCLLACTINFFSLFGNYSTSTDNGGNGVHQTSLNNIEQLRTSILMSFTSLLNVDAGIKSFLSQRDSIRTMVLVLDGSSLKNRSTILLLLALLCHHSGQDAFELILDAMNHYKLVKREKKRFQNLAEWILSENSYASGTTATGIMYTGGGHGRACTEFRVNALMFINTLMTTPDDPKMRSRIQQEFINLDLERVLDAIDSEDPDLQIQINTFKDEINQENVNRFEQFKTIVDSNPSELTEIILGQLSEISQKYFTKMLNSFLSIAQSYEDTRTSIVSRASICVDNTIQEENWHVLAGLVQQIVDSVDQRGRLRNWGEETERLKQQVKTQQTQFTNMEQKLKAEKEKLVKALNESGSIDANDFELLKDIVTSVTTKTVPGSSSPSLPVSTGKPLPTIPGKPIESTQPVETTPVEQHTIVIPPPPVGTGIMPPPPPIGTGSVPPPPIGGGSVPPPPIGGGIPMPPGVGVPPPPIGGGMMPPPPPGMLGGVSSQPALPALPTYNPSGNLRNVHIDPINKRVVKDTIFIKKGVIERLKQIQLDEKRIEELFTIEKDQHKPSSQQSDKQSNEKMSFIDAKRSYNIGIQLASMRLPVDTIKQGIITMDEKVLNKNQINILKSIVPTKEECDAYASFEGSISQLSDPDCFFYKVKDVSKVKERMDAWTFKLRYEDDLSTLKPDIECLRLATIELKESKKFVKFLAVVLSIANFLNAKGRQKDQYGFHLSSLHKMKDTKSKSSDGFSLLHYLVEYIDNNQKDLSMFYDDLPNVPSAKKASISQIKESLQNIRASSTALGNVLEALEKERHEADQINKQDQFIEKMKPFYEQTKTDLAMLEEKLKKTLEGLEEIAILFDEDKTMVTNKPEDFFTKLDEFFEMFKSARKYIQERKKKEEEALRKKSVQLNAASIGLKPNEKGVLEGLENSLRDGSAYKKRRSLRTNAGALAQELGLKLNEQNK